MTLLILDSNVRHQTKVGGTKVGKIAYRDPYTQIHALHLKRLIEALDNRAERGRADR